MILSERCKKYNILTIKKAYIHYSFRIIIIFVLFLILSKDSIKKKSKIQYYNELENTKCYSSPDNSGKKIIHLIITRFLIEFCRSNGFPKKMYNEKYILNAIRVMKKYLFPSLENQSCKNFTWILMLGDKANIKFINSLFKFNNTFCKKVIYQKDIKNYIRNLTKDMDILVTTRIDYDDRIYYDAVNDVRKAINNNRPMILYGYHRGMYYFEADDKYYEFYYNYNNQGAMSTFVSLITVLNKVNDIYTIYDLGTHTKVRRMLLKRYQSFGIKKLDYETAIFDSGEPKFVFVRQNFSGSYNPYIPLRLIKNGFKAINFSLNKFYGKYEKY